VDLILKVAFIFFATAQFSNFAFKRRPVTDPCLIGSPAIGTVCSDGAIYAGTYQGGSYMVTPGNCTNSTTPTCNGSADTLDKSYRGSLGSSNDIVGITNILNATDASLSTERGHVITPILTSSIYISGDSAAHYCDSMTFGGFSDWYLPSKSELAYIYCKATVSSHNTSYPQEDPNCVGFGGKVSALPGFSASWYMSGTEWYVGGNDAAGMSFSTGEQGDNFGKEVAYRVRCIRRY
jgi:hypothetical protein